MIANKISGWYYDLQLDNRLTNVTLHPNTELKGSTWEKYSGEGDDDYPEYRKEPICKAIMTEDFSVSVANSWSEFGGDMLGQMWESIKPLAPYADEAKRMIRTAVEDYQKQENQGLVNKIKESKVSNAMAEAMIAIDQAINNKDSGIDITDYLNRALVVQGTRFSYYSGSGTSFGNLVMKFTIFPTWEGKKFVTVDEQVDRIYPYCIGEFVDGTDGLKVKKETKQIIDSWISWQKPPGGFKANVKNVDIIQFGTLMLRVGAYYVITNLVVENANFVFSKQMAKSPVDGTICPLYCDVTIQLRPATKYSEKSIKKFVLNNQDSLVVDDVNSKLQENLVDSKYKLKDYVY